MAAFMASLTLAALAGWLAPRSRYALALRWWAAGAVLASGGALLNVSQGLLPAELSLMLGNPLMALGLGLLIDGTHRLAGRPPRPLWWLLPALCLVITSYWWGVKFPNLPARVMLFSPIIVWLMGCLLAALWPLRRRGIGVGLAFVGIAALLLSVLMLVRALWAWQGHIQPVYTLGTPFNMVVYLVGAMSFVAIQTGLLLVHQLLVIADLRQEAERDPLTGLLNRHALASRLPPSLQGWALVAVDIDHFKQVNDCHGHAAGDRVLTFVGQVLQRHLREGDLAVRMGGEEFAVLLQGMQEPAAHTVAERLRSDLQRLAQQRTGLAVTASLGLALATAGCDFPSLWRQADGALYAAKAGGRNRVECAPATGAAP
jgi:diguanylate cyclase (GGDEF)-like protein